MPTQNGDQGNLIWRVVRDTFVSTLTAAATASVVFASQMTTNFFEPCTAEVHAKIQEGHDARLDGDLDLAAGFADNAVSMAPKCGCALLLKAEIAYLHSVQMTGKQQKADRIAKRSECFKLAIVASQVGERSDLVPSLIRACGTSKDDFL